MTGRRTAVLAATWLAVTVVGVLLVLYQVGPLVQQRDQRSLMAAFRADLVTAANASYGLPGTSAPTRAPEAGQPVAIIDSADLPIRQVVVEGVTPGQTRKGPGHVPGTAGPGQPGNSVIVGRRSLAGGPFGSIGSLAVGDRIVVTTTQGRSVYVVADVDTRLTVDGPTALDEVEGPSDDDRLTLVTSASGNPFADGEAIVVVAEMDGIPFTPTPQGGRTASGDGRHADGGASAPLVLALLVYAAVVVGAVVGYRRLPWRGAYLITAPPLVAATMILAEQVLRTFPAWS
ncbi:MAG: class E sortase [Actinobacteria bacterium]|nr:class E sortase [Actinomycetota bacterium]